MYLLVYGVIPYDKAESCSQFYVNQRDLLIGLKVLLPVTGSYLGVLLPGRAPPYMGGGRYRACVF